MLERREVTQDTVNALINLRVSTDQVSLVASNAKTLAQAAYEPGSHVWGLWDDDTPVGLMAMIHPHHGLLDEGNDPDGAYLWRLMVAADQQGKGVGQFAIAECIAQAREWKLPRLVASVANEPNSGMGFYEKLGFRQSGRMVEDELEISMKV